MSAERIRELNDAFRTSFPVVRGGKFMVTHGINALGEDEVYKITWGVVAFVDFNEDNDPYGEHDFGFFMHNGTKVFWKIDYYDETMSYLSENPADPARTTRVLTIGLAEEY